MNSNELNEIKPFADIESAEFRYKLKKGTIISLHIIKSYLKNKNKSNPSMMKWLLIAVLIVAVIVSGCTENNSIYSVDQVYQSPDSLKNKKGEWNTVTIQGIAGTDPIYEAGNSNSYYYLAPESKNYPAYEIIYVSTINGVPDPGDRVTVKGKIDKAVDAGKIRIITFIPIQK